MAATYSGGSSPQASCAMCGEMHYVEELKLLPEVEEHTRQLSMSQLGKVPEPEALDENALRDKYGAGCKSLFCPRCYPKILAMAKTE